MLLASIVLECPNDSVLVELWLAEIGSVHDTNISKVSMQNDGTIHIEQGWCNTNEDIEGWCLPYTYIHTYIHISLWKQNQPYREQIKYLKRAFECMDTDKVSPNSIIEFHEDIHKEESVCTVLSCK